LLAQRHVLLQQSTSAGSCDLLVFRDSNAIQPLKVISMTSVNTLPISDDMFMIQTRFRTKPFLFKCPDRESLSTWLKKLLAATEISFGAMVRSQVLRNPEQYRQLLGVVHAPAAHAAPAMSAAPRGSLRHGDDEKHDPAFGRPAAPSVASSASADLLPKRASVRPAEFAGRRKGAAGGGAAEERDRRTIESLTAQLAEREAEIERLRATVDIDKVCLCLCGDSKDAPSLSSTIYLSRFDVV
jgi:hypothetical protein